MIQISHYHFQGNKKQKSYNKIYAENDDTNEEACFALLSCQPICFQEVVKEEQWVKAMNKEIYAIEKNNSWDLVDILGGK